MHVGGLSNGYLRVMRRVAGLVGLLFAVVACGQVEPVLMTVSMPDCTFQGSDRMTEGRARLGLTLNGIGEWGAALVVLEDEKTFADLMAEAGESRRLDHLPNWARGVIELRLSDADAADGVDAERVLDEGTYAVLCVYPDDSGSDVEFLPVRDLTVRAP